MSMLSEAAVDGTVEAIIRKVKPLHDEAEGEAKDAYRKALLIMLDAFAWTTPDWAMKMRAELQQ